ncbi:MAG: hypothetical protein EPN84_07190, partial [Legionella sp.]
FRRIRYWFKGYHSDYWKVNDLSLSLQYQLNGIEMVHGKNGTIIGFDQHMVPDSGEKYGEPEDPEQGNTKRVYLTDHLVEQLVSDNYGRQVNIADLCQKNHPQSIFIPDKAAELSRAQDMKAYRKTHFFNTTPPWYIRLWYWILSFFISPTSDDVSEDSKEQQTHYGLLELQTDPQKNSFDDLLPLIKETNAILLYNKKLFYADVAERKLTLIKKTTTNDDAYFQLEATCTHNYSTANAKQRQLIQQLIRKPITNLLYANAEVQILQRTLTGDILVQERKPLIENLVFCGGGAKIFAHVGVWKALNEYHIKPERFAGSSAGAIMALLCYLGFSSDEINDFFIKLKKEDLMYFDIDIQGLSDSHSLKTALDFIIARKVKQITTENNLPYPCGKITFAMLEELRQKCPNSGLGKELVVTATRKKARKTTYFSLERTPNMEVSEAVKISASFPILYRATVLDGEELGDGGILSNFPTEHYRDDHSTLLESEDGNSLKVLAVQFDNGTERNTIDRIQERVYQEGFLENWFYSLITGVSDPVSSWVDDRTKLRKYAMQSIIIDVGEVTSSSFSVTQETRAQMLLNGYDSAKKFIESRFGKSCIDDSIESRELMFSTFSSLVDLLTYCCYRGNREWFDVVKDLIVQNNDLKSPTKEALIRQVMYLRDLYFVERFPEKNVQHAESQANNAPTFFGNRACNAPNENHNFLLALYPIFLHFSTDFVYLDSDKAIYDQGRHQMHLNNPFGFLKFFKNFEGEVHLVLHVFIQLAEKLKYSQSRDAYANLNLILNFLRECKELNHPDFYQVWDLSSAQINQFLTIIADKKTLQPKTLFEKLRTVLNLQKTSEQGVQDHHDDANNGSNERNWFSPWA